MCVCACVLVGMLMHKFDDCLKSSDVTVWLKLQQQDIKPQYYAFRWLTLLLSQEFDLPGTVTSAPCTGVVSAVLSDCKSRVCVSV